MSVGLMQLLLPALLAAALAWVASGVIHMVIKWHNADYNRMPNEDEVVSALRSGDLAPGLYNTPFCLDMKEMADEDMQKRFEEGPVAFVTIFPKGPRAEPVLPGWCATRCVLRHAGAAAGRGVHDRVPLLLGGRLPRVRLGSHSVQHLVRTYMGIHGPLPGGFVDLCTDAGGQLRLAVAGSKLIRGVPRLSSPITGFSRRPA